MPRGVNTCAFQRTSQKLAVTLTSGDFRGTAMAMKPPRGDSIRVGVVVENVCMGDFEPGGEVWN